MPMQACQRGNANNGRSFNCRWLGAVSHGAGLDYVKAHVGDGACTSSNAWPGRYERYVSQKGGDKRYAN